jgi:CBS domain-containing protein
MLLKDICVLDVACCTRKTTVLAAAKIMRNHHTGALVVVEDLDQDRTPIGIVTDRDIVVEALGKDLDPETAKVGDIMSTHVVVANNSETLGQALERMRTHGVRRIPIVDHDENVVGIVTLDDILKVHIEQSAQLLEIIAKEQKREGRNRR